MFEMETKNNLKDYNVVRRSRYYTIINNKFKLQMLRMWT